jgi:hypothetical protein
VVRGREKKMIIFLDFDGVLHPTSPRKVLSAEENQPFSYLSRLEGVLRDFPEPQIVIASSWRINRPWANVISAFSLDITARIIGATPVLIQKEPPYRRHPRYEEILDFLNNKNLSAAQWIALDDDPELYPANCQNLILCADGFHDAEEKSLREVLRMQSFG